MKVCVGGTFNNLHKGHKLLIVKASESAGINGLVYIGLAKGNLVKNKKNIKSYNDRKIALKHFLDQKKFLKKTIIVPIENKYGLTLIEDYDAIVVSPETEKIAEEINHKRKQMGKQQLIIIKIPYVLSEDGKPISSTRINNKEIDENGNIITED
jgi:pantetheine-phosphate adenylyltransferase